MSKKNLSELIDEILQRTDIVSIVSEYLNLKKSGENFKALCPFHTEKTPSFFVSPKKQIWHCFGCGEGGNVFSFIMKMENVSFWDACKMLAEKIGISYIERKFSQEEEDIRKKLYTINLFASNYFQKILKENQYALKYLKERKLKDEIIEKFKIGYAPSSPEAFQKFLLKEGFTSEEIEKSGLIYRSEKKGEYFAWFRNRIIFPIFDLQNRIIGFAGRSLKGEEPKYINSKETPIFQKGKVFYGINFSRSEIVKEGYAIIVEGYLDFLTPYQEGLKNLVASMGTSLTSDQALLLSRITSEVVIAYDPDFAGKSATLRGIEILFEKGLKIKVASLPEGKDPDVLVKQDGVNKFREIIKSAKNFLDYRLDTLISSYEKIEPEDKVKIIEEISPYLSSITNKIVFDSYIKNISSKLNIDEKVLIESIKFKREKLDVKKFLLKENKVERELLYLMLTDRDILKKVKSSLSPSDFSDKICQKIAEILFKIDKEEINLAKLINLIEDEEIKKNISEILLKELPPLLENKEKILQDYIEKLERNKLEEELKNIQKELEIFKGKSPEKERELLKNYNEIVKKIKDKKKDTGADRGTRTPNQ